MEKKHQQYLLRHIKSPWHSPLRLSFSLPLLCRLLTLPEEPRLQAHSLTEDTWNNYDSKDVSVLRSLYIYFFYFYLCLALALHFARKIETPSTHPHKVQVE